MKKRHIEDFYKKVVQEEKYDVFALSLPIILIAKHIYQEEESFHKQNFDLLHSEVDVLASLYFENNEHALTPTELYNTMIFSSGGMTKILKKLEDRGLITRTSLKEDKRKLLVVLTPKGKDIILNCVEESSKRLENTFKDFSKKEREVLKGSLKKLLFSII
ncbi:MarR family transcriptional regulator [Arcobacter sp. AHV-9/2010]|uniref:MarR family winged helix-turn-helix transcriptional regulator n=1 Tax=Arcobacter sp. AHV-9/2010 TaxID=2021861 RepID=UPI00100B9226|nr:MarR family transcriptional regulator [Arcobacter sp. CECT 9299]RXJ96655.1 MarR family transcriptional regulator [Arcobacter sp. CECT 9299]